MHILPMDPFISYKQRKIYEKSEKIIAITNKKWSEEKIIKKT